MSFENVTSTVVISCLLFAFYMFGRDNTSYDCSNVPIAQTTAFVNSCLEKENIRIGQFMEDAKARLKKEEDKCNDLMAQGKKCETNEDKFDTEMYSMASKDCMKLHYNSDQKECLKRVFNAQVKNSFNYEESVAKLRINCPEVMKQSLCT